MRFLQLAMERIEQPSVVDKVSAPVNQTARKLIKSGPVKDALSGTWLGHPVHPMLVAIPIGAWVGASVLDAGPPARILARIFERHFSCVVAVVRGAEYFPCLAHGRCDRRVTAALTGR